MSRRPYPIDTQPHFDPYRPKDSLVIRILRAILRKLQRKG